MFGEPNSKICFYLHQFHVHTHRPLLQRICFYAKIKSKPGQFLALLLAQEESDVCPTLNQEGDVRKRH